MLYLLIGWHHKQYFLDCHLIQQLDSNYRILSKTIQYLGNHFRNDFICMGNSVPDILSNVAVLKLYANDIPPRIRSNPNTALQMASAVFGQKYCHISIVTCISSSTINSMIGIGFQCFDCHLEKETIWK